MGFCLVEKSHAGGADMEVVMVKVPTDLSGYTGAVVNHLDKKIRSLVA